MCLRLRLGLLVIATLLLWGVLTTGGFAQSTPAEPQPVIDAFEWARTTDNIDDALALFDDSAVVIVQGQLEKSYIGKDAVRTYLYNVAMRFHMLMRSQPQVQGSSVMWTERDEYAGQAIDVTYSAVIAVGHITSLTFRDNEPVGSANTLASAATRPRELPTYTWPAALSLLGLGLIVLAFGRPRRRASQSQLDGRLLVALRRQRELDRLEGDQKAA
jgi:hypothetical protein